MPNQFDRPETSKNALEQEPIQTEILSLTRVSDFMRSRADFTIGVLFGGDRLSCCDEGVGISVDGQLVGIATIAPKGEAHSGMPTIVGVYVDKNARKKQLGQRLFIAAVQRCQERGFTRIHVDSMSDGMKKIIDNLPSETRDMLEVQDCGNIVGNF